MANLHPLHLSYIKSQATGPALMFAWKPDGQKKPLEVVVHKGRGTRQDYGAGHGAKDVDLGEWLPIQQDVCVLPYDSPNLIIEFPIKYLPNSLTPFVCNDLDWTGNLEILSKLYAEKGGYLYQAYCQLYSLLMGLPFWRNNDSESLEITIINISDKLEPIIFKGLPCEIGSLTGDYKLQFESIIKEIANAYAGHRNFLRLRVIANLNKDILEEVYPSQIFPESFSEWEKEKRHRRKEYQLNREYAFYKLGDIRQAMLNSTKIGAGLRWDLWNRSGVRVPVSVYGFNLRNHVPARGKGTGQDFYSLFKMIKQNIKKLEGFCGDIFSKESVKELGDVHFIMASLIKGGVYNRESGKKVTSKKEKEDGEVSILEHNDELVLSNP